MVGIAVISHPAAPVVDAVFVVGFGELKPFSSTARVSRSHDIRGGVEETDVAAGGDIPAVHTCPFVYSVGEGRCERKVTDHHVGHIFALCRRIFALEQLSVYLGVEIVLTGGGEEHQNRHEGGYYSDFHMVF